MTGEAAVSVILIVKNGERFIGAALASVAAQTLPRVEILVIDGQSTDRTSAVAREFPGVSVVPQQSSGIANAWNEGIARAESALLAFLSHDDRWLPDKLARQVAFLAAHPEAELTVTHVQHVLQEGSPLPRGFRAELLERPVPGFIMETLVARRSVFDRVGRFDPCFAVGEDADWFARVRDAGIPVGVLPETLCWKRVHESNTSITHGGSRASLLRAMRRSIERKRAALSAAPGEEGAA